MFVPKSAAARIDARDARRMSILCLNLVGPATLTVSQGLFLRAKLLSRNQGFSLRAKAFFLRNG